MSVSPVSPLMNPDPGTSANKRKTVLGQEEFLNLFITQLKNQNPLTPMDTYQMANQMAQLNSLDSLYRIQRSLEILSAYQSSMISLQATGLIGKRVEIEGQSLTINRGEISEGYYQLDRPGRVKINIFDEKGQLIRTLEEGMKDGSRQKLVWDGKSQAGLKQPDGKYTFQVTAVDERGQPIPVHLSKIETVTGVHFKDGVIYLDLGTEKINLRDVKSILNPT